MFGKATPEAVARMEIRQYDEANHKVVPFEVGRVDGIWCIPSHSNYPADENNHLAEAATALMGVTVLDVAFGAGDELTQMDAAGIRARHNEYGVLDPDPEKIKSSDKGIGMLVTLKDKGNQPLASCIIGKPVPDQAEQHYIRFADKDQVYTVALDTSKLSTHFEDWIERNLLKLNSIDLKQVQIKDYSIDVVGNRAAPHQNGEMTLDFTSSGDSSWKFSEDMEYKKRVLVPRVMAADEEIDNTKMNELKSALDDLKIVDVEKKPAAVPPDLRFKDDQISDVVLHSLQEKGFFAAEDPEQGNRLCATVVRQQGRYSFAVERWRLLRASVSARRLAKLRASAKDSGKDKASPAKDEKKDEATPGMNRYLFVMAEFNPKALTKPKMEPLPEEPKAEVKKAPEKKDEKKDDKKSDSKKPDDKKPGDAKDAPKTEPAKVAEKEPPKVDIKAERERIAKENKRKQEDYDALVSAGKKHVDELNGRFAPWYYVISDDVFRKIHLSRDQIIKKKAKDSKDKDGHDHEHEHDHADLLPIEPPKPGPLDEFAQGD